ncbi:hypothetical protein OBBRIDRAFT_279548 [Obba rivulosa]|uniref:Uncharacterized protein n=1 Tax=Obba rivulosa TaxID=1052685 RepID=A0A8E2J362_9APHY|nr:hypothetical protein OBBRIDRAFT_279548 [Obba rivulosa]
MWVFGQTIIILNSHAIVIDLLQKRPSNNSDGLQTEMPKLCILTSLLFQAPDHCCRMGLGWDLDGTLVSWNMAMVETAPASVPGPQYFDHHAIREYGPQVQLASHIFFERLYYEPKDFVQHIR